MSEVGGQGAGSREQFEIRNSQSAISPPPSPSGSMLHAPGSMLPETWLPLSLAPSRTRSDLLKIASYAALFFLVLLYPFAERKAQSAKREASRNPQSAIRNSQSSSLHAPGSLLPAPCSQLLLVVIFSGLIVAALGFIQRFTWNGMILWFFVPYDWGSASPGNDPRASGPFVNPDHFANYLALIFPLAVGIAIHCRYFFRKELVGAVRILAGLAAFLIFTGILLSLSRSGWIAMLLGVAILVCLSPTPQTQNGNHHREHKGHEARTKRFKNSFFLRALRGLRGESAPLRNSQFSIRNPQYVTRLSLIILSVLLIVSLFFVGPRGREQVDIRVGATLMEDAGLWGRTSIWSDTFKMVWDFPLLGVGLGSWQDLFQRYQSPPWLGNFYREAHNDYIELLAETGIIGFVLLAWFFLLAGKQFLNYLKSSRSSEDSRSNALVAMLLAALGVMAFHEFFDFSLQIPANAFLFTLLFALALRTAAGSTGQGPPQSIGGSASGRSEAQSAKSKVQSSESMEQGAGSGEQRTIRNPQFAIRNLLPACSLLLALFLFFSALNQEMLPYPHSLGVPDSVAEAREMILAHPALPTPHLYLLRLVGKRAPLEWETKELKAALFLDPTNPHLRDVYAGALLRAGRKEEGLREISRSVLNAPAFSNHVYLNGRLLPLLSSDEKNAVEQGFKEAMALDYPGAMDGLASLYSRTGRFADEGKLFEEAAGRAKEAVSSADFSVKAALSYLKAGDPKRAETRLRKAISVAPDDPRPYHMLAVLIYAPQKGIDSADKIISEGIENGAPSFELYLALAEAMKGAGEAGRSERALKAAEEAIQSAAARNGKEPYSLYVSLADTAQKLGFRDKAKSVLARALELDPSSSELLNRLAQLHLQDRNFDRAAYYFRSIINFNPNVSDAYYNLAVAEESQYRFAAAGEAYTRAIELAPENGGYRQRYEALKAKVAENRKKAEP